MNAKKRVVLMATILLSVFAPLSSAENRVVLGLYDSTDPVYNKEDYNLINLSAEMPLNHLGFIVRYHDIAKGLPPEESMSDVVGILSWFLDDSLPGAGEYCAWLAEQLSKGKKYVKLGNFGALYDPVAKRPADEHLINKVYRSLGVEMLGGWTQNPLDIRIAYKDPEVVEFERTYEGETTNYEKIAVIDENSREYLVLNRVTQKDSESAAVVVTSRGGFVLSGYDIYINPEDMTRRWYINPFRFFSEAFGVVNMPCYDTTTLWGKRIFYSHIDGDGMRNVSDIGSGRYSSEIIRDEILKRYNLPVTVSFITSDIDPVYYGSARLLSIARSIMELDNTEAGCHTFSHPLDWNRKLTAAALPGYSKLVRGSRESEDIASESLYSDVAIVTVPEEEYLQREIYGAIEYINLNVLTGGKKVKVFQWSGNCRPPEKALRMAAAAGVNNINGGDTRFDEYYPSYSNVAPLVRHAGKELQKYTSNANENLYTNLWEGPYYGYVNVICTFNETENPAIVDSPPRRVSPINVYYHFYTGEKSLALEALKKAYEYAIAQDIMPVFTSEYLAVVDGFYSGKIKRVGDREWELFDFGKCSTVRVDSLGIYPDMSRSRGVAGFVASGRSTYIHLSGDNSAFLCLTTIRPAEPYIEKSSAAVHGIVNKEDNYSFEALSHAAGEIRLMNMNFADAYSVNILAKEDDRAAFNGSVRAGKDGSLVIKIPRSGNFKIELKARR